MILVECNEGDTMNLKGKLLAWTACRDNFENRRQNIVIKTIRQDNGHAMANQAQK